MNTNQLPKRDKQPSWHQRLVRLLFPSNTGLGQKDGGVKAGQIWRYQRSRDNPFEPGPILEHTVLEVRSGWVRYSTVNVTSGEKWSGEKHDRIGYFILGAELVSALPNTKVQGHGGNVANNQSTL